MKRIDSLELLEREISDMTQKAYMALQRMLLSVGRERAKAISSMPVRDITLSESYVNASGMRLPTLDVQASEPILRYSFYHVGLVCLEKTGAVENQPIIEEKQKLDWKSFAAGFGSTVVLSFSIFMAVPEGMGGIFSGLAAFVASWVSTADLIDCNRVMEPVILRRSPAATWPDRSCTGFSAQGFNSLLPCHCCFGFIDFNHFVSGAWIFDVPLAGNATGGHYSADLF